MGTLCLPRALRLCSVIRAEIARAQRCRRHSSTPSPVKIEVAGSFRCTCASISLPLLAKETTVAVVIPLHTPARHGPEYEFPCAYGQATFRKSRCSSSRKALKPK